MNNFDKIITASEAAALAKNSKIAIDRQLVEIMGNIKEAAERNEFKCFIQLGSRTSYNRIILTSQQNAIVERLKELGYTITVSDSGDYYVPRGLADDDGNGPDYINYGLIISY